MCLLRFIRSPAVTHPAWGDRHAHRAVLCFKAHAHARGEGACRKAFIRANGTQSTARFPEPQAIGCTMSDWGMGCAVHRALASPRLVLGAQPSLDVRNQRLAFLGAHPPNSLAPAALELPISPRYQVPWRVEFRAHLRPRRGLRDRRYRGGGPQGRSRPGRELTGMRATSASKRSIAPAIRKADVASPNMLFRQQGRSG